MSPKTVILFPDRDGCGFRGSFGKDLLQDFGATATLVPILNGENSLLLTERAQEAERLGFRPIVSGNLLGLREVLQKGYQHVSFTHPYSAIVRLDTEDHPLNKISYLTQKAIEVGGMSVGCLELSPKAAAPGSIEDFANADLFPTLFSQFSGGRIILTGASGFKAFAPGVCGQLLPEAIRIMEEAERISVPKQLRYGFDCAMILSAFHQSIPIHVSWIPTDRPENKPRTRIIEQFDCALRICRAAEKIKRNLR